MRSSSILVAGVALIALAGASDRKIYDPARDPSKDLTVAMAEARADGKLVLLEVGGNWCGWCREFDRFVRADPEVEDALRCAFVVVRVNASPENGNARFLARYPEIPGYPYLFVLDSGGRLLQSMDTDDFLSGEAYDRRKFRAFLRKWSSPGKARPSPSESRP